jgi:2-polyprenyl-6-methoxyphenol hydroxylase-like FAD-dependent oxidoreductase
MGQGGAQAVEDAHYLSHIIDNPMDGNKFESFQKRRESKVNSIVNQSWTTGKLAHWKYGTGLRNLAMGLLPKSILLKKMIQMYEIDKF